MRTNVRTHLQIKLDERGFTLLEFVISMGILIFVMSGTMSIYVNLLNGTSFSRNRGVATSLAQSYLEKLQIHIRQGEAVTCAENPDYPEDSLKCPEIKTADSCNFTRTTGQKRYHIFLTHRATVMAEENREVRVFVCLENSILLGRSEARGLVNVFY